MRTLNARSLGETDPVRLKAGFLGMAFRMHKLTVLLLS
jgi:hypothetical protein